jgi:DNA repair protein RecO (recombination protein O)
MKAIVLRENDLGESDKIVTFYSRESGRISGVAKGAKRSKKRFSNKLENFSLLTVYYDDRGRSNLVRIVDAELIAPFMSLREDYGRYVNGALACEHVYYWSRENDVDENIFMLLLWTLQNLERGDPPAMVQIFFQLKLYTLLGYRLHLAGCIKCEAKGPAKMGYVFHPGRHGLLCGDCSVHLDGRETAPLSLNTIKLLQHAQELPLKKLDRLRFSEASVKQSLLLFKVYGQYLLQREISSWRFVEKTTGMETAPQKRENARRQSR